MSTNRYVYKTKSAKAMPAEAIADAAGDDGDGDEDAVLILVDTNEESQQALKSDAPRAATASGQVCLFSFDEELVPYKSTSVHFYAMIRSFDAGTIYTFPTLVSLFTLMVQVRAQARSFLFSIFFSAPLTSCIPQA